MNETHTTALFVNGVIFSLQLLPHWYTGLLGGFAWFLFYELLVFGAFGLICLALLITFVLWIREPYPSERKRLRSTCLTFALMAGTAILCTAASGLLARGLPFGSFVKSFDSGAWIAEQATHSVGGDITPRQKMLGDAIQTVVRNGPREQIRAQFGQPVERRLTKNDWTYVTGPQRDSPFRIDSEWFSIWFDDSGRVDRWQVWSD